MSLKKLRNSTLDWSIELGDRYIYTGICVADKDLGLNILSGEGVLKPKVPCMGLVRVLLMRIQRF